MSFKKFILNEAKQERFGRIEHLEDFIVEEGLEGFTLLKKALDGVIDFCNGKPTDVVVSQKIDGCVHGDTEIKTSTGDIKISELIQRIRSGEEIFVYGAADNGKGVTTISEITGTYVTPPNKNWVEIALENGAKLKLTEDHQVYTTNKGWIEAGALSEGDDIKQIK